MGSAVLSRSARRFLVAGVAFLVLSQIAALAGLPRRTEVVLGLQGFVLTVAFGKAYSLVPSYFDRTLVEPRTAAVHLPLQVVAVGALAVAPLQGSPDWIGLLGPAAWAAGVVLFVGSIGATIASNPLGRETGTGGVNEDRAGLDRLANLFVPIAIAYLLVGSYELLAGASGFPPIVDGNQVRTTHLLAAGFAVLLLLSVGYRLLPRFLVGTVSRLVAGPVLVAGAVGPALLAVGYPSGLVFQAGAVLESVAVVGFAASYCWLYARTDRDRVGFYGPLAGVLLGVVGVGLGVWFAFHGLDGTLALAHLRVNVFGLLGLSILGVLYQFYPPAVSDWPGEGDRLAVASLALATVGVALAAVGPVAASTLAVVGHGLVGLGGTLEGYLLVGAIYTRAH